MNKPKAMTLMLLMALSSVCALATISPAKAVPATNTLVYATGSGPVAMDPIFAWDSASDDVLNQVCQGLLWYNVTEASAPLEPLLAASMPVLASNQTSYTVTLRQGVRFQDGTPFNASAAQFTFNRLAWFMNETGTLPASIGVTQVSSLFVWANGTFIINSTKVISNYVLQINLNEPYGPFLQLLTFTALYMMSPTEVISCGCQYQYLNYASTSENLTGTGPYTFNSWDPTLNKVYFTANPLYWGQPAKIHYLVFDVITDSQTLDNTMLAKQDSFSEATLPADVATANSTSGLTLDNGPLTLTIEYLSMNNVLINQTFRCALSYCFNYSYFLNTIDLGLAAPLHGVIPNGMNYYNNSITYVTESITTARMALIDAKLAPLSQLNNNSWWADHANGIHGYSPLASYNFTYNSDNANRGDIGTLMQTDAKLIGINITIFGTSWGNFLNLLFGAPMDMEMFCLGWAPDYNDPDDYCGPLLANDSSSNGALFNDPSVQVWINEARATTNSTLRQDLYNLISANIQNVTFPYIWLDQGVSRDLHLTTVQGFPDNKMFEVFFSYCYNTGVSLGSAPVAPVLNSISPATSATGVISLTWNSVAGAVQYRVFRSTSLISSVSGMIPIATVLGTSVTDYLSTNGTYYYVVVAVNPAGISPISNDQSVVAAIPLPKLTTPMLTISPGTSTNGTFFLSWNSVTGATTYNVYCLKTSITSVIGLTPLASGISATKFSTTFSMNSTYYFVVMAFGTTTNSSISNCVSGFYFAVIPPSSSPPSTPGPSALLVLLMTGFGVIALAGYGRKKMKEI